jgi:very-short-patch-repair endonuclease
LKNNRNNYKSQRIIRRKYIEFKKAFKRKARVPLYPFLAIQFILEQIKLGYKPSLDRIVFQTDSPLERMLYYAIRCDYKGKIVPQYPLGPYWVDLAIPSRKLALECDGQAYHSSSKMKEHDRKRDAYMKRMGWKVMRFTYQDLLQDQLPISIQKIYTYMNPKSISKNKKAN